MSSEKADSKVGLRVPIKKGKPKTVLLTPVSTSHAAATTTQSLPASAHPYSPSEPI
jgi:hypothetical protein